MDANPVNPRRRDLRIDAVRGLAILLVVLGHACQRHDPTHPHGLLPSFIYSFHMALFAFLSGFIVFGRVQTPRLKWLGGKVVALVVPFVAWGIVFYYVHPLSFTGLTPALVFAGSLPHYLACLPRNPGNSLWYLWFLAMAYVLLALVYPLFRDTPKWPRWLNALRDVVVIVVMVKLAQRVWQHSAGPESYAVNYMFYYGPAFFTGYLVAKYRDVLRPARYWALVAAVLVYPLLFAVRYHGLGGPAAAVADGMDAVSRLGFIFGSHFWIHMSGSILAGAAAIAMCRVAALRGVLVYLGQRSLGIYAAHMLFLNVAFGDWHWQVASSAVAASALAVITMALLSKSRVTGFIFLGKPWRFRSTPRLTTAEGFAVVEPAAQDLTTVR